MYEVGYAVTSLPMIDALLAEQDRIDADDRVRAVILTGAGRTAFSAGTDIPSLAASIAGGRERALREIVRRGHTPTRRIKESPKPVIVAVNGLAYGDGCEITEAAPLATETACFTGTVPTDGVHTALRRFLDRTAVSD